MDKEKYLNDYVKDFVSFRRSINSQCYTKEVLGLGQGLMVRGLIFTLIEYEYFEDNGYGLSDIEFLLDKVNRYESVDCDNREFIIIAAEYKLTGTITLTMIKDIVVGVLAVAEFVEAILEECSRFDLLCKMKHREE